MECQLHACGCPHSTQGMKSVYISETVLGGGGASGGGGEGEGGGGEGLGGGGEGEGGGGVGGGAGTVQSPHCGQTW